MDTTRQGRRLEPVEAGDVGATPSPDASWPWACLGCDATLFHDVLYCRACRAAAGPREVSADREGPFRSWIRGQSYPRFLGTVAGIASVELALTALWLQVLLAGAVTLPLPAGF